VPEQVVPVGVGAEAGHHLEAEAVHLIGERVELGAVDAGVDQDSPSSPRTTTELLQTHSLCRTQTPSATSFSIARCCQVRSAGAIGRPRAAVARRP